MAQSARLRLRRNGGEELPRYRGLGGGGREGLPHAPKPEARGGSQEDQPHAQGKSHGYAGTRGPRGAIPR